MTHTVLLPDDPKVDTGIFESQLTDVEFVTIESGSAARLEDAPSATAIVANTDTPVPRAVFEAHPDLVVVARLGTGFDNIDLGAATDTGVWVTNVPEYSTDEVATHALSLLLGARRTLLEHDLALRAGTWDWTIGAPAPPLVGSTVGVVSFGAIARRFVDLLEPFDTDVVVYDPYVDVDTVEAYGARVTDFESMLEVADAVSVHAPLTPETEGMFDEEAFATLPDHAVIVNVGRGGIIDEHALVRALEAGELAGAGLDVFAEEPLEDSPLLERNDVFCTPHSAWYSEASKQVLNETAAANVSAALEGSRPPDAIDVDGEWL